MEGGICHLFVFIFSSSCCPRLTNRQWKPFTVYPSKAGCSWRANPPMQPLARQTEEPPDESRFIVSRLWTNAPPRTPASTAASDGGVTTTAAAFPACVCRSSGLSFRVSWPRYCLRRRRRLSGLGLEWRLFAGVPRRLMPCPLTGCRSSTHCVHYRTYPRDLEVNSVDISSRLLAKDSDWPGWMCQNVWLRRFCGLFLPLDEANLIGVCAVADHLESSLVVLFVTLPHFGFMLSWLGITYRLLSSFDSRWLSVIHGSWLQIMLGRRR